jgi:mono/diheme cytochrome c family protein
MSAMLRKLAAGAIAATVSLAASRNSVRPSRSTPFPGVNLARASAEPTRTTWDSVYTAAQAAHGDTLYKAGCIKCHGATLAGGDQGSPLTGSSFLGDWSGLTLDQLFDKVRSTMPPDNPKSIPPKDVADIVAYLLAQNQMPAGTARLSESVDQLKQIKFLSARP